MRKTYHICLSSHSEVMYRSEEDLNYGFNCFAVAALDTESRALADSFLPDHEHLGACTDAPEELIRRKRISYTRYFNAKYERTGKLGERNPFILELEGVRHQTTALSYIYRQALHHGLVSIPYAYKHSSVNVIFREEMGKPLCIEQLRAKHKRDYLPHPIPETYRMCKNGLLLRDDIIDSALVQEMYVTPRNFNFQMTRFSGEEWEREQEEDRSCRPPVCLGNVEPGANAVLVRQMLLNEKGRVDKSSFTDLELCEYIDNVCVPDILKRGSPGKSSVYLLNQSQRRNLGNDLWRAMKRHEIKRLSDYQLRKCLVIE